MELRESRSARRAWPRSSGSTTALDGRTAESAGAGLDSAPAASAAGPAEPWTWSAARAHHRTVTGTGGWTPHSVALTDEIRAGPSNDGGWRPPRRLAAALAVVAFLAAVGAVVITNRPAGRPSAAAPSPGAYSYSPIPLASPSPSPPVLVGTPLPAPTGLRLPFAATVPGWWDVDSGRLAYVRPAPPPQENGYGFGVLPRAHGFAALRHAQEPCDGCPGPPEPVQLVSQRGSARLGPLGNAIAAAANADGVWVTRYRFPAISVGDPRQSATVELIDLTGRVLAPPRRLPANTGVIHGVTGGLLLNSATSRASTAFVWNPATGVVGFRLFGQVLAATAQIIAWVDDGCSLTRCSVHVRNLVTGGQRDYLNPVGRITYDGALSPDGWYLALREDGDPDPSADAQGILTTEAVEVVDVGSGRWWFVPGSERGLNRSGVPGYSAVGWSPDSRYLVLQVARQLALWSVGRPELWLPPPARNDVVTEDVRIVPW